VSNQDKSTKPKPPVSKKGRPGKQPQRFTQREIERAGRGAPDRTIRICRDGTLELVPVSEGINKRQDASGDDLDRELKELEARHGQG
jgi:hypothetical protein